MAQIASDKHEKIVMPNPYFEKKEFRSPQREVAFYAICELAKNKNVINLSKMLVASGNENIVSYFSEIYFTVKLPDVSMVHFPPCRDTQNSYTPTMMLAIEGEYEAVEFLLDQWKNINEKDYRREKTQALYGYAFGLHVGYLNQWIQEEKATVLQVFRAYEETTYLSPYSHFKQFNPQEIVAFTENEDLRRMIVDKYLGYREYIEYDENYCRLNKEARKRFLKKI